MALPIVCPSHKRADRVLTKKAVAGLILCVPESQVAEYREHNPDSRSLWRLLSDR
jgi:hypothetical protein